MVESFVARDSASIRELFVYMEDSTHIHFHFESDKLGNRIRVSFNVVKSYDPAVPT